MNSMKSAFENASVVNSSTSVSVNNKEAVVQNTITLTVEELDARIAAAITASKASVATPVAPIIRQVKGTEDRGGVKAIRWMQKTFNSGVDITATKVVAPVETYLEDSLIPDMLTVVAAGSVQVATRAAKVTGFFTRVAEKAAAKSLALTAQ